MLQETKSTQRNADDFYDDLDAMMADYVFLWSETPEDERLARKLRGKGLAIFKLLELAKDITAKDRYHITMPAVIIYEGCGDYISHPRKKLNLETGLNSCSPDQFIWDLRDYYSEYFLLQQETKRWQSLGEKKMARADALHEWASNLLGRAASDKNIPRDTRRQICDRILWIMNFLSSIFASGKREDTAA